MYLNKKINEFAKNKNHIKLHLGCGAVYLKDYINIDFYDDSKPDFSRGNKKLKADLLLNIEKLSEYANENSCDHILLVHVFEHFTRWKGINLLKEFYKVLKPGGIVEMEHPDLDKVIYYYLNNIGTCNTPIGPLNLGFTQFYGNQWDELDYETHRYVWTKQELKHVANTIGFKIIELSNNTKHGHVPGRDMRVVLQKQ